jgi:predicted nucleotidyltransferase
MRLGGSTSECPGMYGSCVILAVLKTGMEIMSVAIDVNKGRIKDFCIQHGIQKFSLFGSVIRDDFHDDSDIDVLVEFDPERIPSLFGLIRMEEELEPILGRKVDMRTPEDLSRYFRDDVMGVAVVQYVA